MQAVAAAAVLSAQQAAVQARSAAENAMQILLASKDQMRMRLGAMPDMVSSADQAIWREGVGAAQDGVAVAMDNYHQVTACLCYFCNMLHLPFGRDPASRIW
jgi:hypothetical protein